MTLVVGLLRSRQAWCFAVLIESILRVGGAVEAAMGREIPVRPVEVDFSCGEVTKSAHCGHMEEDMRNSRTMIVLAGLALLVAMVPAFAQSSWIGGDVEVKFTAPMAFYAGDKLLPAGTYEVKQGAGVQGNTLLIRGKGKNETYVSFTGKNLGTPLKATEVTFNKYGDKEFLNAIKMPTGGGGSTTETSFVLQLEPSAMEQAAAKAAGATPHTVAGSSTKKK